MVRTAASGSRQNNAIRVDVGGSDIAETIKMSYLRGDQSSDDHWNTSPRTWYTWSASANDDVQLEKFQQGGQNTGANDSLRWMGGFFINLAAPSNLPVATITLNHIGPTAVVSAPQVDADFDLNHIGPVASTSAPPGQLELQSGAHRARRVSERS